MKWQPLPIGGGAYKDDTTPWTSQDRVNYMPVSAERNGTRSPVLVKQAPGSSVFTVLEADQPIRGMHNAEGLLLVVCGSTLYTIASNGAVTARGTIPGVARVSMTHNQITGGNEVAIANGLSGYVFNTKTLTLTQITDDGFSGAKVFDFIDGYIMGVEAAGRFWFHSDLASATSYNTIDRAEAEAQPDRIVTGKASHREWVVFGERSAEFFRNTGEGTGTFQRVDGTELEIGCPSSFGVAKLDNTLFFVGHDGSGYRLDGYTPVRITTHAIEQAWSRCSLADCYTFTFEDQGHKVWYVTFVDGQTWGFDVATGEWHRRVSQGIDFWRMADMVRWNNGWIAGDYASGALHFLDWNLCTEAGEELVREITFPVIHDNGNRFMMNALLLEFDSGKNSASFPPPKTWLSVLAISGNLGNGPIAEEVSYQYTSTGGLYPHTFSILSGSLPDGLSMSSSGLVTGTRGLTGTYNWVVRVTDTNGDTADLADTSITTPFTITGDLANGTAGVPKAGFYTNVGGLEPITYAVTAGAFPTGMTLGADGVWSGTPDAGTYSWTVTGTDDVGNIATLEDAATFNAIVTFSTIRVDPDTTNLSNGNRDLTVVGIYSASSALSVIKNTGKWYVEFEVLAVTSVAWSTSLVVATQNDTITPGYNYYLGGSDVLECRANGTYSNAGSMTLTGGPNFADVGDIIGVAFDADTREVWVRDSSGYKGGSDPATGATPLTTLDLGTGNITVAICFNKIASFNQKVRMNAGQEAFEYAIPTGFSALSA